MKNLTRWFLIYKPDSFSVLKKHWRFFLIAAVFHIIIAISLFYIGRKQLVPALIDRDGIIASFAPDSYGYQQKAIHLMMVAERTGLRGWFTEQAPLHVKLISIQFAILGSVSGYAPLSTEPLNLVFYLALILLTCLLGNEVGGERVGLLSAISVSLFPTLLLHTLQLLKDPIFIVGVLFLMLCVTTWLTRTYKRSSAMLMSVLMIAISLILLVIRASFGVALLAIVCIGFILLIIRQFREKRLLCWNMVCPLLVFFITGWSLVHFHGARRIKKFKHYPSDQRGELKSNTASQFQIPSVTIKSRRSMQQKEVSMPILITMDHAALKMGVVRSRYAALYSEAGSGIDRGIEIRNFRDLFFYLPRAFQIGCWAPFPNTWFTSGRRIGNTGMLLSGAETLTIYLFQLLALFALLFGSNRLSSLLLLSITVLSLTALACLVPNVGAIYRLRYSFWIVLIILGMKGFEIINKLFRQRGNNGYLKKEQIFIIIPAFLFSIVSCSSPSKTRVVMPVTSSKAKVSPKEGPQFRAIRSSFLLINSTGVSLKGIYLSPNESIGWEENILGGEVVSEGDTVDIELTDMQKKVFWDLRIESDRQACAEWKKLDVGAINKIKLLLGSKCEKVVVAELE